MMFACVCDWYACGLLLYAIVCVWFDSVSVWVSIFDIVLQNVFDNSLSYLKYCSNQCGCVWVVVNNFLLCKNVCSCIFGSIVIEILMKTNSLNLMVKLISHHEQSYCVFFLCLCFCFPQRVPRSEVLDNRVVHVMKGRNMVMESVDVPGVDVRAEWRYNASKVFFDWRWRLQKIFFCTAVLWQWRQEYEVFISATGRDKQFKTFV